MPRVRFKKAGYGQQIDPRKKWFVLLLLLLGLLWFGLNTQSIRYPIPKDLEGTFNAMTFIVAIYALVLSMRSDFSNRDDEIVHLLNRILEKIDEPKRGTMTAKRSAGG